MATGFSVFVNIGGKVNPSLNASVAQAKSQVRGLEATLAGIGARLNAPFVAVNKHLAETSKRMAIVQRAGRNATFGVTAPTGFFSVSAIKAATERDKAANQLEALGGVEHSERLAIEGYADSIAEKYGRATDILKTFNEMLKAGFDVKAAKGSIASILEGSVVAGDMSGADIAGAVSKIVTQYGLNMKTVEDASASSRRIVDNLVYGANSTSATMQHMVDAYKFVGSAASAAGESIESTNALIIALSKAGQLGSEAGVALRSAYVRVLKPTKEGRATMARLGLDYGNYVSGGKRTGSGVAAGLSAAGFDMSGHEKEIDAALAQNEGNTEKQRKAIYDAVVAKFSSEAAKDRESVLQAVDSAFTMAGSKIDLTKLLIDLKKHGANQGDLARIFEGRQSVRMLSLLKADLEGILKDINENAPSYGGKTFAKSNQGLPEAIRRLDAAWQVFSNTLVKAVTPEIVGMMERLASTVKNLAATSPGILKLGIGFAAAAAAAGPLLLVLGAVGRVGLLAMRGLNFALLGLLLPFRLLGTAVAVGLGWAATRLSAMVIGLRMLTALGAGATLAALGGSLLALGRAVLLFPVTALRATGLAMWALVANPVGLIITALVAALAALGVWVYNNWSGIKQFFAGFGEGFMNGLGPAAGSVKALADGLGSVVNWLSQVLGPLDATNAKWREWGATLGGVVAQGVQLVISGISNLIGLLGTVIGKAIAAGSAIKGMFTGAASAPAGGAAPAVPLAGARALGGPVTFGKPYLVGERGPELFVPGSSGRIETNDTLRRLTADGATAVAATESRTVRGGAISFNPVFNISGDDPRGIGVQVRAEMQRFLVELESEQRGLLSD
ncbi:phage tail tape measure protein [Pseudorhodoplanes sinuspersici]|uniref:Phage tail tape measure protein n=1 Tax=Pseudorhodoplanes sinuspersici TaxID=1235591 RepID=A0A1W6ZSF2_9HYPH|nr:phage tail tape measure protein [Pseudorhodoplanes sinuspersici]ARP99674.1 phage tail tape measure protein [Pseudorhodoplanes sinuspersici]RKE70659.1 TP901 family phage tail tape measure protein [Pseudorhodoplanes sinuspersici]